MSTDVDDPEFDDAEIQIELRPDGTVRFEVGGVPGAGCEALEQRVLAALGGRVVAREHTASFYQSPKLSLLGRAQRWLGRR